MEKKQQIINRREFLQRLGLGTAAVATGTSLVGCGGNNPASRGAVASVEPPTDKMTYRENPKTGEKVSILGYGCMRWPTKSDGNGNNILDQETINDLVDYAIAHGVNYFDTAPPYCQGLSEKVTGIALSRHPRSSYYIATKMSNHHIAVKGGSSKEIFNESLKMYRNSFECLQTDYIDYYLLHNVGGGNGIPFLKKRFFDNGLLDFLLKEREAGMIRNLGFSYHGDVKVFDYLLSLHDEIKWDFVQIQFNYVDFCNTADVNVTAEYLYEELAKRNIPAVIMEPLLGGRLANLTDPLNERLQRQRPSESIASWAFRFAGTFPNVLTVLSGMTYKEHLQDNIRTYSPLEPCTESELALLEDTAQVMTKYKFVPCTGCQYCMPCPYGVDIPGIFAHFNKCINEGNISASSQSPDYRKARRAFLIGYDRSVPKLRQASHCIGCKECVRHCPQKINIPAQMQRIDRYVEDLKQGTL